MEQAQTRLRNTFKYPSDDSHSDTSRDEMDEEEQSSLLTSLATSEATANVIYTRVSTALPLLSLLPFFYHLLSSPSRNIILPSLLAITSLLTTAFTMHYLPPHSSSPTTQRPLLKLDRPDIQIDSDGPLLRALPWLNAGVCAVLLLIGGLLSGKREVGEGYWLSLFLPAVMLGVVSVVRASMREVGAGLRGLEGLRYEYKGA